MSPQSDGSERPEQGRTVLVRLLGAIAAVLVLLGVCEIALRAVAGRTDLVRHEVEIDGAATLFAKLASLEGTPVSERVVLLGDSLILGKALRDAGIEEWRSQNLAAKLETRIGGGRPLELLNLGMNGALPADVERIVDAIAAIGAGGVVMDVNLRHFSADFTRPETTYSRSWLRSFSIDENGMLETPAEGGRLDAVADTLANNWWLTYRLRGQLRQLLLGASPYEAVRDVRDRINGLFRADDDPFGSELRLILNARSRYESISLSRDNPQVRALTGLLRKLSEAGIPAVVFYATERPDVIAEITEPALHRERLAALEAIVREAGGPGTVYVGPLETLPSEAFIDHVHVLPQGYEAYADALAPRLTELLESRRGD